CRPRGSNSNDQQSGSNATFSDGLFASGELVHFRPWRREPGDSGGPAPASGGRTGASAPAQPARLRCGAGLARAHRPERALGGGPAVPRTRKKRDELGVAVAFEVRGKIVGTVRAVPMCHGLTLAEKLLLQVNPDPGPMLDDSWEMGRLVISPEFRSGQEALRRCLLLSLSFLHDRAPVANLHATCTHALARLYRRIGFEVIATDVPLHGTSK